MHCGPPVEKKEDKSSGYKSRLGIRLFFLYGIVYAGFVLINSFNPKLMGEIVAGQTLAVVYGFGLIIFALILALLYNGMCTREEERLAKAEADGEREAAP